MLPAREAADRGTDAPGAPPSPEVRPRTTRLARWDLWIPAAYAAVAALWILFSDLLVGSSPGSEREHLVLSIAKGLAFVAVTAGLLHGGLRWVSARERRTLARVEASEALLRAVIEAIPDPVFVKDRESRWLYANPATLEVVGKALSETIGRTDREIYRDEQLARALLASDRRILASGVAETVEEVIRTRDGDRTFQSAKAPLRDGRGRVIGIVGNARDVTERRRADEARRRYELLAQHSRDVMLFVRREDGRILEANAAACAAYGYSEEELRALTIHALRATPGPDVERQLAEADANGVRFEAVHRRKDGGTFPVEVSAQGADLSGTRTILSVIRDISERKRAADELAQRERDLETVLQTALDGFYVVDLAGRILEANEAYSALSGYTRAELLSMTVADLEAAESAAETAAHIARIRALGADRFETLHRRKDGRRITVAANVRYLPDRDRFVVFCRDVTAQKRLEEQVRLAQKLESVGQLAGGVAHDFNNLLTVILSCSQALRRELAAGRAPDPEDVDEIHGAGERARDLTRQLLAFARRQVIAPTALDLDAAVRGSEKMLRRLLGEDIDLELRLAAAPWTALCDAGQLEQVIVNLAVNARDAMPTGGALRVETSRLAVADGDPALAAFSGMPAGEYVQLVIEDTGSGMTPDVQARIFEPFFTTKEVGKGTGLGLATVYGIVKQSDGFIGVESRPGAGSRFAICFPRLLRAREQPAGAAAPAPAQERGTETVLLVEDDLAIRKLAARALSAGGYDVLVAASGVDALALAERAECAPDLVVTDVVMPGLDGRAVATELRRRHPALRVLYVSGYPRDVIAQHGLLDSGIHFLQKPFHATTLLERVRAVLDAPEPASPAGAAG